jgi:hypothetical protein
VGQETWVSVSSIGGRSHNSLEKKLLGPDNYDGSRMNTIVESTCQSYETEPIFGDEVTYQALTLNYTCKE